MNVTQTMDAVVTDLRRQLQLAKLAVETSVDWFSGNAKSTARAHLEAVGAELEQQLHGTLRARVLAKDPTYPFARWAEYATTLRQQIAATAGDTSSWQLSGVLSATVSETAQDIAQGTQQAVTAAVEHGPLLLVLAVVGLVAVAVIKVT